MLKKKNPIHKLDLAAIYYICFVAILICTIFYVNGVEEKKCNANEKNTMREKRTNN